MRTAASIAVSLTGGARGTAAPHGGVGGAERRPGRVGHAISDATRPGAVRAAAMAAAASAATEFASGVVRTQWLNGRAVPSTSEVRGAS